MKLIAHVVLLSSFLVWTSPVQAGQTTLDAAADLDGDGKKDEIHLTIEPTGRFALEINGKSELGKLSDPKSLCDEVQFRLDVVDIDKRDKHREIRVFMTSGVDSCLEDENQFFTYGGGSIRLLWAFRGQQPQLNGYGIILVGEWREFWLKTDKLIFDSKKRALSAVAQPFHYVGVEAIVDHSIPIYLTPHAKDVVANLKKDSTCSILLYDGSSYLIRSTTGLVGWASDAQVHELRLPSAG